MDLRDRLVDFLAVGNVAQGATQALSTYLQRQAPLGSTEETRVSMSLSHLDTVREGFQITLRTSDVRTFDELRWLVNRFLFDWSWLEEQGLTILPGEEVHLVQKQVFAFGHAFTALAVLPRLPARLVSFPGSPTYADIPVPRSPGEVLTRIDEMEEVLYEALVRTPHEVGTEPIRRTYGFFETSAWLAFDHLRRFLRPGRP